MKDFNMNKYDWNMFDTIPVLEDRVNAQIEFHQNLKQAYLDLFFSIKVPLGSEVDKTLRNAIMDITHIIRSLKKELSPV